MTMVERDTNDTDLIVVEENAEGTVMTVSSLKRKSKYTIYKPENGYGMFQIKSDGGHVPDHLSGSYTSRKIALSNLKYWLEHSKESKEAKWDRMFGEEKAPPPKLKEKKIGTAV